MSFRRADVQQRRWYCRACLPGSTRYMTISLKTTDAAEAREKVYVQDAELRFRIKHEMPVFDHKFSEVAKEFAGFQEERADGGQITYDGWRVMDFHIRNQLNNYVGNLQITQFGQDRWSGYPVWRH